MALTRLGLNQSINLASNVTGTLATGNGGTGATSFAPGKFNQMIVMSSSSATVTTASSYSDTNLTASITPTATNSKILIYITDSCQVNFNGTNDDQGMAFRIKRTIGGVNTTLVQDNNPYEGFYSSMTNTNLNNQRQHISLHSVDTTHNTTSAITYIHQIASYRGNSGASASSVHDNNRGNMTLIEVLA